MEQKRILLTVSYDGTAYVGWQYQDNGPSIQDELEKALQKALGTFVRVTGASRTDAGVHALGQRAHFDTCSSIPPEKYPFVLNRYLPPDIRVTEGRRVPDDFHARFQAVGKLYTYRIHNAAHASAILRNCTAHVPVWLDAEAMRRCALPLIGTHDFIAFAAAGGQAKTSVRTIDFFDIQRHDTEHGAHHRGHSHRRGPRQAAGGLHRPGTGKQEPPGPGRYRPGLRAGADAGGI